MKFDVVYDGSLAYFQCSIELQLMKLFVEALRFHFSGNASVLMEKRKTEFNINQTIVKQENQITKLLFVECLQSSPTKLFNSKGFPGIHQTF